MRNRSFATIVIFGLLLFSFCIIFNSSNLVKSQNTAPILEEPAVYIYEDEGEMIAEFAVYYQDMDGDEGTVQLTIDSDGPVGMRTSDFFPVESQYYFYTLPADQIDDFTEFRFSANDDNGSVLSFPPENEDPFQVGDYQGWGELPILSNPHVYFDGDDWVFNVTYQDPDGDEANSVQIILDELDYYDMETEDPVPLLGQNYVVRILQDDVGDLTEFYFEAEDAGLSYAELRDEDYTMFEVRDFDTSDISGSNENGNGDGSSGLDLSALGLNNPEVVVGIIGLVAIGTGSAYGVYRRKKKHGRFSELLTEMDKIYGSFKTNPKRCELELEKMRSTINEDLKKSTIDDNNYSILKGRIDEILGEIRSESIKSEIAELPKDIELKIKDMLIDGEITRAEYDKILPLIKGSDMAVGDKEKTKKIMESWMKKEKDK